MYFRAEIDRDDREVNVLILVLLQRKLAACQLLGLCTVLVLFQDFVLIGFGLVLDIVGGELYGLRLAGDIGCGEVVRMREVELGQTLRLGEEFPGIELVFNLLVVANTKN